jgi:hypothetical protein
MMAAIQHLANKSIPKKHAAPFHPLVDPGDSTRSAAPRAKTHRSCLRHHMSLWRRAHQAVAQKFHLKQKSQLQC